MIWLLGCAIPPTFDAQGVVVADRTELVEVRRAGSAQPVVGTWTSEAGNARFRPLVPLSEGDWEARFRDGSTLTLTVAATERVQGHILRIGPDGPVPQNLLGFHVVFSAPVDELQRELVGPDGPDPAAFADIELWSEDRTELNLLLHPGRTKTGIPFADELGPNLVQGGAYTLVVNGVEHAFEVGPADRVRPDPDSWRVDVATLRFDERLRTDLGARAWEIEGAPDMPVDAGPTWVAPLHALPPGDYAWVQTARVEDLAGNTPQRLFDARQGEGERATPAPVRFPFTID